MAQGFYAAPQIGPHPLSAEGDSPDSGQEVPGHLAWMTANRGKHASGRYTYLLILRFALVNLLATALLAAAYVQGLVAQVFAADRTYLTHAICLVFLGGLAMCTWRILQTSKDLNQAKNFDPLTPSRATGYIAMIRGRGGDSRAILASTLRLKLSQRISVVRHVAGSLVILGLIGTVLGFIIALSGVVPERVADVQAITPMISTLISGMSTALFTTLVGAVLNIWLMINYHILAGGTVKLISAIVELGESHGQA